jgi:hypothetical protein
MSYDYASHLLSYIKSGTLEISYDSQPFVRIESKGNERKIEILSDDLNSIQNFLFRINKFKRIAKGLSEKNITLLVMNKGKPLAKLGSNAKPGLSRILTGKNLEITRKKSNDGI